MKCYLVYRIVECGFAEERIPVCVFLSKRTAEAYVKKLAGYLVIKELNFNDEVAL